MAIFGRRLFLLGLAATLGIALADCNPVLTEKTALPTASAAPTAVNSPTPMSSGTPQLAPATQAVSAPPPSPVATEGTGPEICSPLDGFKIEELPAAIANPYSPPRLGSDDPHQGVDLAELSAELRIALEGLAVHAVLGGEVSAVIPDRFPYGNAILVESRIDRMQGDWSVFRNLPPVASTPETQPSITCPEVVQTLRGDFESPSVYLLYAHLKSPPTFQAGDTVACGQLLGAIGSSGNALNPHLHLEARLGPGGVRFPSMSHYDTGASPEEMASYCTWRVSGLFQPMDPMQLFSSDN